MWTGGVAEVCGLGVESGGEELSEGLSVEQAAMSAVDWVSVGCSIVVEILRVAVRSTAGRAAEAREGELVSGRWSRQQE
jgi:hypothetical protein